MAQGLSWLIFGAGAIGTYIGGSLALLAQARKASHRVVFVERPEVAAEVRQRGLHLNLDGQEHTITVPVLCASLEQALTQGPFDVGLFALKSYDTRPALAGLAPFTSQIPPLLCLQNGVENEAALAEALGAQKVITGTVTSAVGRRGAGDIVLERLRGMGVAAGHPLSRQVAAALDEAGLHARLYPRPADMKWSKLLINLLANATSAILDMTPGEVFANPHSYRLEVLAQREALRVMAAQGIRVVDLPGTPVRLLALGMRCLPPPLSQPLVRRFAGKGRGEKMPSFHIDLHSHRGQSEVDFLNGAVVRFGARAGVLTPVNQVLNQTLLDLTHGIIPLDSFRHQPDKLAQLIPV
jgi:2-dehydropantoate 2-reductase